MVLPVLNVLFEGGHNYVEKKECKVSQALPNPKRQLRRLPEKQLQSGGDRGRKCLNTVQQITINTL